MCASLAGVSFPGWERRAAEGARGEKRPQPISIGDADDAVHLLLALTSGEAREAAALVHHHSLDLKIGAG